MKRAQHPKNAQKRLFRQAESSPPRQAGSFFTSLFLAVPAVGAELLRLDADRLDHIVEAVVAEAGEVQLFADHIHHLLVFLDRKSTRLNSSHVSISYAVFCLKKKSTQ